MRSKTPSELDLSNLKVPLRWWLALFGGPIILVFTIAMFYQQVRAHLIDSIAHAAPGQYELKRDADANYQRLLQQIGNRLDGIEQRIDRILEHYSRKK